jgi:hypothetical protein
MEYNFSVTQRMLIIFIFCSILFVLSIFFLGAEVGKKLAVNSAANEILSKEKMESQLKNIKSEAEFVKNSLNKLAESTEKK